MVADSSDNNPKSNGGAEKKKERTAGQFFHIGEQGEQGDASAKAGAELHPLDYWVLDTGAAWTMTPRKELLDDVRAAPINEVCSASVHALKVAGAGRAAFKGADGKPVVLHDVLLVPDLKANLISLRKLGKAGVSTSKRTLNVAQRAVETFDRIKLRSRYIEAHPKSFQKSQVASRKVLPLQSYGSDSVCLAS
ncbi:unnamed protein product [Closterium sp. NIES-53]